MATIYEAAGGMAVLVRLAEATHRRCLADPLLNHPFSHAGNQPDHTDRLAAYWAEVLGGPPTYTGSMGGSESHVQRLHAGEAAAAASYKAAVEVDLMRAVKRALDPGGPMNPGVLLPPD